LELQELAAKAKQAGKPQKLTVSELLSWYGYSRRGSWIVEVITRDLKTLGMTTFPWFASMYIHAPIYLSQEKVAKPENKSGNGGAPAEEPEAELKQSLGPSHQISLLKAANTPPTTVTPNDTLARAITLMQMHDFSQLPVMIKDRELKGMISWKSIGRRLAAGVNCAEVRHCMDDAFEVPETRSIIDVIREIGLHDCVVVRGDDKRIRGIVTAADIADQFRTLSEPFLLLGDIEDQIRRLIERASFDAATLNAARGPGDDLRPIEKVADLDFGGYLAVIGRDENWKRLKLNNIDRVSFIKELNEVREIRNGVMHFDPDGIPDEQLATLRRFARFLDGLMQLGLHAERVS